MPVAISSLLNYLTFEVYGVSLTYWLVSEVFERRRSSLLWYSYFVLRSVFDCNLIWLSETGTASPDIAAFHLVWRAIHSTLAFLIIWLCWRGDYVLLGACAVICDPIAYEVNTVAALLSNLLCKQTAASGFFEPIGVHTLVAGVICLLLFLMIRIPLTSLLRLVCRFSLRHRNVWGVVAVVLATYYTVATQATVSLVFVEAHAFYALPATAFFFIIMALALFRQSRIVTRRARLLEDCLALSRSYDATIHAELTSLERDRKALEGHEDTLRWLSESGDSARAERIDRLQVAYKKLSSGSFCDRPALDAVLVAGVRRLQESGAEVSLSVAGIPKDDPVPVAAVLTLFNLASEAAARNVKRQDDDVELRIRGIGGHVLFHLEVPSQWGTLWAKRYLSVFGDGDEVLIREKRQGDRRVVIVLCEGAIA